MTRSLRSIRRQFFAALCTAVCVRAQSSVDSVDTIGEAVNLAKAYVSARSVYAGETALVYLCDMALTVRDSSRYLPTGALGRVIKQVGGGAADCFVPGSQDPGPNSVWVQTMEIADRSGRIAALVWRSTDWFFEYTEFLRVSPGTNRWKVGSVRFQFHALPEGFWSRKPL